MSKLIDRIINKIEDKYFPKPTRADGVLFTEEISFHLHHRVHGISGDERINLDTDTQFLNKKNYNKFVVKQIIDSKET